MIQSITVSQTLETLNREFPQDGLHSVGMHTRRCDGSRQILFSHIGVECTATYFAIMQATPIVEVATFGRHGGGSQY